MLTKYLKTGLCTLLLGLSSGAESVAQKIISNALTVTSSTTAPPGTSVRIGQPAGDAGGATSIRFKKNKKLKTEKPDERDRTPRQMGYYERDRDLGQTFTVGEEGFYLRRITLKVNKAVLPGALGAPVSIQLFEVTGTPVIHDNGTTSGRVVDWTDDPRADDYLTGETYRSLAVFSGGRIPAGLQPQEYLHFQLLAPHSPYLEAHKQYAFLVLFDEARPDQGLSLANNYWGKYPGGHAIRREGKGTFPPKPNDQNDSSFPASFSRRVAISPGSLGFPDVDTWRDFVFFLE
ncbi:hypothetical protein GCM10027275_26250 [Rhabdobacter roseus]|uniref:Uncharacterized protein n=1 Tax=Rhabdobacter roseus TaxID=1655419 RepID=A0A840TSM5_9BACT|nr:hypothetical protein [Rhabdobacter roseus]MBB5284572.1 hypothetical protein [Rhabdobacter roseus]